MGSMAKYWTSSEHMVNAASLFRNHVCDHIIKPEVSREDAEVMRILFYNQAVLIIEQLSKLNDLVRASLYYTHKYPIIWPDMFHRLDTIEHKLTRLQEEYSR